MFVNREREIEQLERLHASDRAELFILYGRRRVGKTELLRVFQSGRPGVYFVGTLSSDADQLAAFSEQVWRAVHPGAPAGFRFPSWEAAFYFLGELPGKPVVVLDEFTYIVAGNRSIPSILQKVWDEVLSKRQILLILCGSYVGMMEREVLSHQAPLYGRRTASALLQPLPLSAVGAFLPRYNAIQRIEVMAVLGGMPYYLQAFSDSMNLLANIRTHVLDTRGRLFSEPRLLLMDELREPRNYFSIMRAIAHGQTRLNEITQEAKVGESPVTARYLDVLQRLRLVKRVVPVTEPRPEKSRKGVYRIIDPFLRFWFTFVHPNMGSLEMGLADSILDQRVKPRLDQFVSQAFEDLSREFILGLATSGKLPFLPERIGSWWDDNEEIDVVALSEADGALLAAECKWSNRPVGVDVLGELERKVAVMERTSREQRPNVTLALFSKSGFTDALRKIARKRGVVLVSADRLDRT